MSGPRPAGGPAIRIGTRGSRLALLQADLAARALQEADPSLQVQRVIIKTKGDRILDAPLSKIGDKGLFIREIEEALLAGEVDMAVHSLKDLPGELPAGLLLAGVLPRGDVRDAFLSRDGRPLERLGEGDTVGTSSLRRQVQVRLLNPRVPTVDIRGNVDTRIARMQSGACAALVLAASGLERMGYQRQITAYLDPQTMLPAAGQGIIGLEVRRGDPRMELLAARINHPETWRAALAERAFLRRLEAGCQVPLGCQSLFAGGSCTMRGLIADPQGKRVVRREVRGPLEEGVRLAEELADRLLEAGGREILAEIRGKGGR